MTSPCIEAQKASPEQLGIAVKNARLHEPLERGAHGAPRPRAGARQLRIAIRVGLGHVEHEPVPVGIVHGKPDVGRAEDACPAEQVEEFRARLCAVAQHRFATEGRDAVVDAPARGGARLQPDDALPLLPNKDAILAAVRAAAFDRFADALERRRRGGGGPRAAGQAVGPPTSALRMADPDRYRLMFDVAQPHPDRYPELARASTRARRTMSASLERLVRAGVFHGDPELLGLAFWSAHARARHAAPGRQAPAERDFEAVRAELMRLLVTGARAAA